MGKATGVFLILAGVGTAALVLPAVDKDAERQLADVVRIATGGAPQPPADQRSTQAAPTAAPARITIAPIAPVAAPAALPPSQPAVKPATAIVIMTPAATEPTASPVLKTQPQVITRNATALPARPADTEARADLARDIQRELKRVGCYDGDVSGEWSPGTRRAMKTFIDRVNAALPIDEPDHILRTMVQGHPGFACGKACPSGQSAASDGRCLPSAIVAQKAPTPKVAVPKDVAIISNSTAASVTTGALASDTRTAAARPAAPKPAWETTIAAAPVGPLPGSEPRMAIGGPVQQPLQAIGPRTPNGVTANGTSGAQTNGSAIETSLVPGAIAALAAGAAAAGQSKSETRGLREPLAKPQRAAAVETNEPAASDTVSKPAAVASKPASRPQPIVRRPPPEVFKFPAPNYLGLSVPKFTSFQKPERSSFGPRVYESYVRNLR